MQTAMIMPAPQAPANSPATSPIQGTKCYACGASAIGHALRCSDGGPARGDDHPKTTAVPACRRHAQDPRRHPALDRLVPRPAPRLRACTIKRAKLFVEAHHRHLPKVTGALFAAAVDQGHVRVGVVVVSRPKARHLDDGETCEVTRVAIDDDTGKRNACSMLYGAARRAAQALGYSKIITYTRADEPGTSLKAAGWTAVAEVDGESWDRDARPRDEAEVVDRIRWEAKL